MNDSEQHTLARKLEYLRKNLEMLAAYRSLSANDIENNLEKRLAAERLLQTAIETAIDCSRLIVAVNDLRKMRDERDAFVILAENKIIGGELSEKLLRCKGFRNILVHEYASVDPKLMARFLNEDIDDLIEFAKAIARWLAG